jgi:hypothetical protein
MITIPSHSQLKTNQIGQILIVILVPLSGTPRNDHIGITSDIVISVSDGNDGKARLPSFSIEVINVDDLPVLQAIENQSVNEDFEPFTIELSATDIDGDQITYDFSLKENPIANLTIEDNKLKITAIKDANGTQEIIVIAKSNGKQDKKPFTLTINPKNDAPKAKAMKIDATEGESQVIKLQGSDVDNSNEELRYKIVQLAQEGTITALTGADFTYTSTSNTAVSDSFTYKVCDESLCSKEANVSITIKPIDDPPTLKSIRDQKVDEDSEITIPLFAWDIDHDVESIQFSANAFGNDKIKSLKIVPLPDRDTGRDYLKGLKIKPAKNAFGTVKIQVTATSNNKKDSETFNLEIQNINDSGTVIITADNSGTPKYKQNETLWAKIEDPDFDDFIYPLSAQWRRNGDTIYNPIGASSLSYRLTNEDVGQRISVFVSYKDMTSGYTQYAESEDTPEVENINDAPVAVDFTASMGSEPSDSMGKVYAELKGVKDPDMVVDKEPLIASDSKLKYKVVREPDYGAVHFYYDQNFFEYNRSNMSSALTKDSFAYEVCDPQGACDRATVTIYFEQRPSLKEACPSINGNKGDCITNFPLNPETEKPDLTVTREKKFKLALEIEDIDSNKLTLELKEFPEWLKVTKPEGIEGNTFTITKNVDEGFDDVILEGEVPAKVDGNNANNLLKLTLTDKNIAKNEDLETYHFDIKYTASVSATLTNDAVLQPYVSTARTSPQEVSNNANNQSNVTQYNLSLSKDINTIEEGEYFEFDLKNYISVHDLGSGKIKMLTKEGKALPSWLNYAGNALIVNEHEELDDEEEEYQLQMVIEDPSGKKIQVFFKLLIEQKTKITGDFRAVMVLNEEYTLTQSDFFYSNDQKTSNDVEFKISELNNIRLSGISQNKDGSYTFSAEELKEGKVKLQLLNSDFAYFNVEIVDSSESTSQKTSPQNRH